MLNPTLSVPTTAILMFLNSDICAYFIKVYYYNRTKNYSLICFFNMFQAFSSVKFIPILYAPSLNWLYRVSE